MKVKLLTAFLISVLVLLSCNRGVSVVDTSADSDPAPVDFVESVDDSGKYYSEEGKFYADFPRVPEVSTITDDIVLQMYMADIGSSAYFVSYGDLPAEVFAVNDHETILQNSKNGMLASYGFQVEEEKYISINGNKGLYVHAAGSTQGMNVVLLAKIFLVDHQFYQVMALGDSSKVSVKVLNDFLDSFEFAE